MSVISYNPQMNILTQIVKDIEVSYSIEKRENTICIDLDIESIMKQLDIQLYKFSGIYREETGDSLTRATIVSNNISNAPIRIYLGDKFIDVRREFKEETSLVSTGYKIVRKGE